MARNLWNVVLGCFWMFPALMEKFIGKKIQSGVFETFTYKSTLERVMAIDQAIATGREGRGAPPVTAFSVGERLLTPTRRSPGVFGTEDLSLHCFL
jgi:hypothetical protein